MVALTVLMDASAMLSGVPFEKIVLINEGVTVARLADAMQSGEAAVMIVATLPDGRTLVIETSEALLCGAADAFRARSQAEREIWGPL